MGLSGLVCDRFTSTHLFGTPGWTRNIKMSTEEKGKVSPQNQIPIDRDQLKEEQKAELKVAIEDYERRCLLLFSSNRSGEVFKKYDFPTLPPCDESQKEDRMVHMMNQAIRQAFLSHAPIMANFVHNAVLKTL